MVLPAPIDRPFTYHDLVALPDDGKRYELILGELIEMPSPTILHQQALVVLVRHFLDFVIPRKLGLVFPAPLDVRLDPHITIQPDIVFLSKAKRHLMRTEDFKLIVGAPDLIVEILSPSNRGQDFIKKAALYAAFGVLEYWIVDPVVESIFLQVLRDGLYVPVASPDGIARSDVLPGFSVNPRGLLKLPRWMIDGDDDDE